MTLKEEIFKRAQRIQDLITDRPIETTEIFRLATEIKQLCAENIGVVGEHANESTDADSAGVPPAADQS